MAILNNSNAISTAGGYDINNSLRFRSSASAYLNQTLASGNRQTSTWSGWVKIGALSTDRTLFGFSNGTSTAFGQLVLTSSNTIDFISYNAAVDARLTTTQVLRDPSAWYHIVAVWDTTNATSTNRLKLYINGSQVTAFGTATYPAQNYQAIYNNGYVGRIGAINTGSLGNYFDGYLSEVNFIDGQALTPSSFGETDTTTGAWKPKAYTGTYGTNGFYLPFNSSNATGFSSYYGNFNGSNQYLTFTGNTGLQFGTGDFTVEYWMYQTSVPSQVTVLDLRGSATTAPGTFGMFNTSIIYYNGTSNIQTTGFTPVANTWAHVAFSRASGVMKIFVNGVQYYSGSETTNFNTGTGTVYVGRGADAAGYYMPGYVSNLRVVKGTALYTANFTPPTSALTAVSGTQLLMLQNSTFIDNSSNAFSITNNNSTTSVSGTVGAYTKINRDSSGNNNHWAMNNINYTASGVTYDAMIDSPTLTSATVANYAVLNPNDKGTNATVSEANLKVSASTNHTAVRGTFGLPTSGKWYWESTIGSTTGNTASLAVGICTASSNINTYSWNTTGTYSMTLYSAMQIVSNGSVIYDAGSGASAGTVFGIAWDADNNKLYIGVANTFYSSAGAGTGNPSTGSNPTLTPTSGVEYYPYFQLYNQAHQVNFGQRPFTYTHPTGFKALNTFNLPDSTIKKGSSVMTATLYTGNSPSTNTITTGFKPDLVWVKNRTTAGAEHELIDSVRGSTKGLQSSTTAAEVTDANFPTITSTGFTVGASSYTNQSGASLVAWQWQAGQGSTSTNTSGSITSTVSVNTTAGFSIVTYTGTGANATVGHGLGVAPKMIIVKRRSSVQDWPVYHANQSATPQNNTLYLNLTNATAADATMWNNTAPTSTVFSLGTGGTANQSTGTYVAYCWAEIAGFSKFGSFTSNALADGTFVYLGFRPKYIMFKPSSYAGEQWYIQDSSRSPTNVATAGLYANLNIAEDVGTAVDLLSNGFKLRVSNGINANSGATVIYAAFAESPFKNANAR